MVPFGDGTSNDEDEDNDDDTNHDRTLFSTKLRNKHHGHA